MNSATPLQEQLKLLDRQQLEAIAPKLTAQIRQKAASDFRWFVFNVFSASFPKFYTGQYIEDVCTHLIDNPYTMDVTGRNHFKSTRLYADVMWRLLAEKDTGWEGWYFSFSQQLAGYHIAKIKEYIKDNIFFDGIIDHKPTAESVLQYSWDGRTKMTLHPSGLTCVHPDQSVITYDGKKQIKNIEIGDEVLTSDGNWHKVGDVIRRPWNPEEGDILSIKASNVYEPLKVSKKHQIMVIRPVSCRIHNACYPWHYRHKIREIAKYEAIFAKYEPEWIPAGDLKLGDLLVVPKYQYNQIKYDGDVLRLIGYWIAEGYLYHSIDKQGRHRGWYVRWITSAQQPDMVQDIVDIVERTWGRKVGVTIDGKTARLSVGCKELFKLCEQFGRGAVNKHIPTEYAELAPDLVNQLIKGYWLGDGYLLKGQHSFASVSLELLETVQRILFNQSISSALCKTANAGTYQQNGKTYSKKDAYRLEISDSAFGVIMGEARTKPLKSKVSVGFTDNFTLLPIKLITEIPTTEIYDLMIDDVNDFATPFTISNSFKRGVHADHIYVDDPLQDPDNKLNPTSIYKINNVLKQQLLPMINKGGTCRIVGCVGLDTLVQTPQGLVIIKDMFPENTDFTKKQLIPYKQRVFGKDGWDTTSNLFVNGMTKTNKITLVGGYSLECSQIHPLWSTPAHVQVLSKKMGWRKSSELKVGDWVALSSGNHIFGVNEDLSIDEAYLYGLYVAEGCSETTGRANRITITNLDPSVITFLKDKFDFHNTDGIHNRKNNKSMVAKMRKFGLPINTLCGQKFIPPKLLLQTKAIQVAFLQGLYDGDGHSSRLAYRSRKPNMEVVLTSTSKKQLGVVQQMLLNFGIFTHLNSHTRKGHWKNEKEYIRSSLSYSLKCTGSSAETYLNDIGFRIPYKQKSFTFTGSRPEKYKGFVWRRIKDIQQGESLTVDFTIPDTQSFISNGIVSHNTPQTPEDFFFDKMMQKTFKFWITPAIVDEPNKIALWPEWMSFEELVNRREEQGERIFNPEYMATPVYAENSYVSRQQIVPLCTEENLPVRHHSEFNDDIIVAGMDIGKKVHPSHLAVFKKKIVYDYETDKETVTYHQLLSLWMDGWDYGAQVKMMNDVIEYFNVDVLRFDNTRSELEGFMENGTLSHRAKPVVLSAKNGTAYAAGFGALVDKKQIFFVNEARQTNQIVAVTSDLQAMTSSEGHGDSFWSCSLATASPKKKTPRILLI
jgi:intein/homing endonuclease